MKLVTGAMKMHTDCEGETVNFEQQMAQLADEMNAPPPVILSERTDWMPFKNCGLVASEKIPGLIANAEEDNAPPPVVMA